MQLSANLFPSGRKNYFFFKYLSYLKTLQQLENKGTCYFHILLVTEKSEWNQQEMKYVEFVPWFLH